MEISKIENKNEMDKASRVGDPVRSILYKSELVTIKLANVLYHVITENKIRWYTFIRC